MCGTPLSAFVDCYKMNVNGHNDVLLYVEAEPLIGVKKNSVDAYPGRTFHEKCHSSLSFFGGKNGGQCGVTQPTLFYWVKVF